MTFNGETSRQHRNELPYNQTTPIIYIIQELSIKSGYPQTIKWANGFNLHT